MQVHTAEHMEDEPGAPGTILKNLLSAIGDTWVFSSLKGILAIDLKGLEKHGFINLYFGDHSYRSWN